MVSKKVQRKKTETKKQKTNSFVKDGKPIQTNRQSTLSESDMFTTLMNSFLCGWAGIESFYDRKFTGNLHAENRGRILKVTLEQKAML